MKDFKVTYTQDGEATQHIRYIRAASGVDAIDQLGHEVEFDTAGFEESGTQEQSINIYRNGVWAGTGKVIDGQIVDCAAQLGPNADESEDTYCAIEENLEEDGDTEVERPDGVYTWNIG